MAWLKSGRLRILRDVGVLLLIAGALFLFVRMNKGEREWPPECGMGRGDFERHMEAARRLSSEVLPSAVYDFNGNGAVDSEDLGRLRRAVAECD